MKKTIVGIMIVMLLALTGCGKTINLNDYVQYEITGYNEYGKIVTKFDYNSFEKDLVDAKKLDEDSFSTLAIIADVEDAFKYKWTEDSELSNGDKVELKWDVNTKKLENNKVKLSYKNITENVKGLKDIEKYDAFKYVDVNFDGILPAVTISVSEKNTAPIHLSYSYSYDVNTPIVPGTKVLLTIETPNNSDLTSYCAEYGLAPEKDTIEYTVPNLSHYATSLSEISDDMFQKMISQTKDSYMASTTTWVDPTGIVAEYDGAYMLYSKNVRNGYFHNYVDIILKCTVNNSVAEGLEYYYSVRFEDVIVLEDGKCSVDLSKYRPCGTVSGSGWFTSYEGMRFNNNNLVYLGTESIDSLFSEYVTSYLADYNYETTY